MKDGILTFGEFAGTELADALGARIDTWVHWAEDLDVDSRVTAAARAELWECRDSQLEAARIAVRRSWHRGKGFSRWFTYGTGDQAVEVALAARSEALDQIDGRAEMLVRAAEDVAQRHAELSCEAARSYSVTHNRILRMSGLRHFALQSLDALGRRYDSTGKPANVLTSGSMSSPTCSRTATRPEFRRVDRHAQGRD